MPAHDSNHSTWYLLRYASDFESQPAGPYDPLCPLGEATLFYDDARHVLELLPVPPENEADPLPGIVVDINGEIYRAAHMTHGGGTPQTVLMVERCDGSRHRLACDPFVTAGPRGMALDRRGHLYAADARARRVVVLLPEDGSVLAALGHSELREPVDVAVTPGGLIYVADRGGTDRGNTILPGRIFIFGARFQFLGSFLPRNSDDLPESPRPNSVMIEPDGTLAVADGNHPRLLHFSSCGKPLGDLPLPVAESDSRGLLSQQVLRSLWGSRAPRFVVGACALPRPSRDGGELLAAVHRALRRTALRLRQRFAETGTWVSAALDGGTPGVQWHRVELDADLPEGTAVTVESATAEEMADFDPASTRWHGATDTAGALIAFRPGDLNDTHLIFAPPGRFLWLRVKLRGSGTATPSVRALRVLYPRFSYLDLLPRVYRRDPEGARFLERYLALFELSLTRLEDRFDEFAREVNPDGAPREMIDWLACLVDLAFDPSWPVQKRRALVASAMELYQRKGTPEGLKRYVELYTGRRPEVLELFLERPGRPPLLGRPGGILGCSLYLGGCQPERTPRELSFREFAHRFQILVYLEDPCEAGTLKSVVERIVQVNKPAHTEHRVCFVLPEAAVGEQSQVGLDLVVGGRESPGFRLPLPKGSTLGLNTILGERRPGYVRPLEIQL